MYDFIKYHGDAFGLKNRGFKTTIKKGGRKRASENVCEIHGI